MWLGGVTNYLSNLLGNTLRGRLDDIELRLRFSTSTKLLLCAVDKLFSMCANYPKITERYYTSGLGPITLEHCSSALREHQVPVNT